MACKPAPVALHHGAAAWTWLFGGRALPGRRYDPDPGLARADEVFDACRAIVGRFDAVALITRRQEARAGMLALLIRDDRPVAFVKAVPEGRAHGLEVERACLGVLSADPTAPLLVPVPLGGGTTESGIAWTAMAPLPGRPHRPAWRAPIGTIIAWLQDGLRAAVPTPGTDASGAHGAPPTTWLPMHGDFAPWNLRRILWGPLTLFDFEDAAYAPAAADRTYWLVTSAVLRTRSLTEALDTEAVAFWRAIVAERLAAGVGPDLDRRLLAMLDANTGTPGLHPGTTHGTLHGTPHGHDEEGSR